MKKTSEKPKTMGLMEIANEMAGIAVKDPDVLDGTYERATGRRYFALQQELISREKKYQKFDEALAMYDEKKENVLRKVDKVKKVISILRS